MRHSGPVQTVSPTDEELLDLYLSLPNDQREKRFADTRRAATMTGLSVRTIQFWIESGSVRAIVVGKKYRADLDSVREYLKRQLSNRQ
jgi:excisionase family DNA binding protein